MPAFVVLSLCMSLSTAGWAGHPPAFVFTREAVAKKALGSTQGIAMDEQRWLARKAAAAWVLEPDLRRVSLVVLGAGSETVSQAPTAFWPLPPGVKLEPPRTGFLGLAPWGETGTWLVDGENQTLWRLASGAWEGPWPLPDPVADAVALGAEEVVLQTPTHPSWALARVGRGGVVAQRFGGRLLAPLPLLDRFENTWRLAISEDGKKLFLAHTFRPLLRAYTLPRCELLVETELTSPEASRLAGLREQTIESIKVNPETGCVSCRLVRFASALEVSAERELLVHLGRAPGIERLDGAGRWLDTVPVVLPRGQTEWVAAGMAVRGGFLLAREAEGVVGYRLRETAKPLVIRVVDEDGKPIERATVAIELAGGLRHDLETDAAGTVSITQPPPEIEVTVRVRAPGFRRFERFGLAREVLGEALTLVRADTLCVAVTARSSRQPVARFELSIALRTEGPDTVGLERGGEIAIEDPEGTGCLEAPWDYPVVLTVRAEGFASQDVKILEYPDEPVPVELEPAAVLRVTVSDAQGRPVRDAVVALRSGAATTSPGWVVGTDSTASTDETGMALLARLAPGRYRALVRREGFLEWVSDWTLEAGACTKKVVLDRGARVVARVTDRHSGAGVAEARIELGGHSQISRRLGCSTSHDGRCEISGVPAGTLLATATASGRARTTQQVVVPPDRREVNVEIRMVSGIRVHGRVAGTEMYEIPLGVRIGTPGFEVREGPVGPDGRYAIDDVPAGRCSVWVRETPAGGALLHLITTLTEDRDAQELDLDLPVPRALVGWVREGGAPCFPCRAVVELQGVDLNRPRSERRTDPSGRFEVRMPVSGQYRVQIWNRDGSLGLDETVGLTMSTERTFELGGGGVEGRVVDDDGTPVASASVSVSRATDGSVLRQLTSGLGGAFRFDRLPAGLVRVSAVEEGTWAHADVAVETGETARVELVLERRQGLRLRLRDGATAVPLRAAAIGVQARSGAFSVHHQAGNPDGVFRLPVEPGDVAAVVIGAPGYAVATVRGPLGTPLIEVALSRSHRSFNLDVRPEAGTPCTVTLLDASGMPVALSVEMPPGPAPLHSRTVLFNFLPIGSYELVVGMCEGKVFRRTLALVPGSIPLIVLP